MENLTRRFQGIWIPADIWLSKDLSVTEKVMLAEIASLQSDDKGCYASNNHFSEHFGLSRNRISEIISGLAEKGLIEVTLIREGKQIKERQIYLSESIESILLGSRKTEQGGSRKIDGGWSENREEKEHILNNNKKISMSQNSDESRDDAESKFLDRNPEAKGGCYTPSGKHWGTEKDRVCAQYIFDRVMMVNSSAREPSWPEWCNVIRLMRVQDGRNHREICDLFKWANTDDFWAENILSPASLRKQWDKLTAKRLNSPRSKSPAVSAVTKNLSSTDW